MDTLTRVHFTELLTAINGGTHPDHIHGPDLTTAVTVRRQHLRDLRTGIDQARSNLNLARCPTSIQTSLQE